MWGVRSQSLGTHCPPTCPISEPQDSQTPSFPYIKAWRTTLELILCSPHTSGQVRLCIHVYLYTHEYTHTNPNLPSLYSCKNIFPMECRSLHESGVVGSDDHTVLSGVCSELLWTVAALYFVIERAYSSDNHEHSSRFIWHPLWWHSLSDAGKEPSRKPLCHIWESATCLFTCRQPRLPPLGAALMLVSFNKQILCVSVSPHHIYLSRTPHDKVLTV